MARQARLFIPDCPILIELQGVGQMPVFKSREAYRMFRDRLPFSANEEHVDIHAYCICPSQVALLISATESSQPGRFIQNLNRHVSPGIKQIQNIQSASVWEPRFKSTVVQPGMRSLKASLYVELLALRLGQTPDPITYPWSSFGVHVGALTERWINDLPAYWALGNTPFERQVAYRQLADNSYSQSEQAELEDCLHKGWLWSDSQFADAMESQANRAVRPRARGRPRKSV